MSSIDVQTYTNGTLASRERTTYGYAASGDRISSLIETDADADGVFEQQQLTEFLVDGQNHTGYSQVLRETTTDVVTGQTVKVVDYYIGLDQVSQTTTDYTNGVAGVPTTLFFLTDGHGSVRVLTDLAGAIANVAGIQQLFMFSAFGNLLNINQAQAATSYLYNSERTDPSGQIYMRARYYDPTQGRFLGLDPFYGNKFDPLSFHKYLFTQGNPIAGIDPSGLMTLNSTLGGISVSSILMAGLSSVALISLYTANQYGIVDTPQEEASIPEGFVPFWGSGKNSLYHINNGQFASATLDAFFFMTDFLVFRAFGKLAVNAVRDTWRTAEKPGIFWAVWGVPQKAFFTRAPNHFMWQIGKYVYDATLQKGVMTVSRELAEKILSYATWKWRLSIPLPAIFTTAGNTCGATGGNCFFQMITAMEQAGVPEVLQSLVKSVYLYEESHGNPAQGDE